MREFISLFVSRQFCQTSAKKYLGLNDMKCHTAEIERCTKEIRVATDEMAMLEICSLAINHGLSGSEDECNSGSDVEEIEGNSTLTKIQ